MSPLKNLLETALCKHQWVADLFQATPAVRSFFNTMLINTAVTKVPTRPYPLSTFSDYSSWDSLTDRTYSGRHLPPVRVDDLPPVDTVLDQLYRRPAGGMTPSAKSTVLFSYFAQWFTDAFLRTTRTRDGQIDPKLRNTSPHDVDLTNLYGQKFNVFGEPKDDVKHLRSFRGGTLKSQEIHGEEYPPFYYDADGQPKEEFRPLSMTDSMGLFTRMLGKAEPLDRNMFAMGGDRLNAQVGFTAMNTLFLREHNRICGLLRRAYPQWDDERLFQTARNINIGVLVKVVIEDYINHISPLKFPLRLEPGRFERQPWYRTNWMTVEFNVLYRWHSLVPDAYRMRQVPAAANGRPPALEDVPVMGTLFNNGLLTDRGLGAVLEDASRQTAGEITLRNTSQWMLPFERSSLTLGRDACLQGYNAYRNLTGRAPARSFEEISKDPEICRRLKDLYRTPDRVEFITGIFAEPVRTNSALPMLTADLVAVDAFSQAFTNPLLSARLFNETTFSKVGLGVLAETSSLREVLNRNVPGGSPGYYLSMTRHPGELRDGPLPGVAPASGGASPPAEAA